MLSSVSSVFSCFRRNTAQYATSSGSSAEIVVRTMAGNTCKIDLKGLNSKEALLEKLSKISHTPSIFIQLVGKNPKPLEDIHSIKKAGEVVMVVTRHPFITSILQSAKATAKTIPDRYDHDRYEKARALTAIATEEAKHDPEAAKTTLEAAKATAKTITNPVHKAKELIAIATEEAKTDPEAAKATAETISDPGYKVNTLIDIAKIYS